MATTLKSLGTITLSADTMGITFSSIPSSYTDLVLKISARSDYAAIIDYLRILFNGDDSSIYTEGRLVGYGTTGTTADRSASQPYLQMFPINGASSTASAFSAGEIYIPNYSGNQSKSFLVSGVVEHNTTANNQILMEGGLYDTGTAISSITMSSLYGTVLKSGSTFYLYGVEKFGTSGSGNSTTGSIAAKATGGTITTNGKYIIHTFTDSGTFTPSQNLSVEYLVVAGGAGGGNGYAGGGGGGAGGYRTASGFSVTSATPYTVTVGAGGSGGAGSNSTGNPGTQGSDSVFSTITSAGGGFGAGVSNNNGNAGGSGGGGSRNGTGGAASPAGQGNAGGTGNSNGQGGGGGGAGAAGGNAPNVNNGGTGGNGLASSITGTSVTRGGGGGGGTANSNSSQTSGGSGGGGISGGGSAGTPAGAGTANTGGGGGGGGNYYISTQPGGAGGSGIVIVRYAI